MLESNGDDGAMIGHTTQGNVGGVMVGMVDNIKWKNWWGVMMVVVDSSMKGGKV